MQESRSRRHGPALGLHRVRVDDEGQRGVVLDLVCPVIARAIDEDVERDAAEDPGNVKVYVWR